MTSKKPQGRRTPPLCAEFGEDDGVDPRRYFRAAESSRQTGRKTLQLCTQVQKALNYLLAGDNGDELLALFQVVDVRPAPDQSQLLAIVQPAAPLGVAVDPREVLSRLADASGRLRAGVAAAITRKRAPKLLFQIAAAPQESQR